MRCFFAALQFGFCSPDEGPYCLKTSCQPVLSPWSSTCLYKAQQAPVKRFNWVVSARAMSPDGFNRSVGL